MLSGVITLFLSIATTASIHAAMPVCESASSDIDGDGYGWENSTSCIVEETPANILPDCSSPDSDPDGDGYGWENSASCRVVETPQTGQHPVCESASSDPDGDGFGWENNATCVVESTPHTSHPECQSALSDPDGDGFGWENNATCVVVQTAEFLALAPSGQLSTGTPVYQWTPVAGAEMYRIVVSDSQGNRFTYATDSISAACEDGTCEATPDLGYYDNNLSWYVESTVNGAAGPVSNTLSITTPVNTNIQPILSNTSECEAWPSVAYDKYVLLNNTWNSDSVNSNNWQQTIAVDQLANGDVVPSWSYDWLGQYDGNEIEVKSYPEVIYGSKLGTHVSGSKAETGLPELVRDLPEFTVQYAFSETGNAERNVALESFFHDSCNIAGPCDDVDNRAYEMMIWVQNPTLRTPGDLAATNVQIDNQLWNVYIKPRSNKHYIAFTAVNPSTAGTLRWNRFVDWTKTWTAQNATALDIDPLLDDFCMGAIEMGTETWWGSGTFKLDRFEVEFDGTGENTATDFSTSGPLPGVLRTSALAPVNYAPADTCLTLQDAINGDYHGPIELGDFLLSTNTWNWQTAGLYPWEQCIYANESGAAAGWTYEWGAGGGSSDYEVRSYPELIYGVKSEYEISAPESVTGLPVRLDRMPYISIDYSINSQEYGPPRPVDASVNPLYPNGTIIRGERNIAVESFLHPSDANGNCPASVVQRVAGQSNHTFEVMLWLDSGAERLPSGAQDFVADVKIDGLDYKVYTKINDRKYVAFVAQNPRTSGSINWTSFLQWAQLYAHRVQTLFGARTNAVQIQDSWCLANILVGTEIFWGDGEFNIVDWEILQTE